MNLWNSFRLWLVRRVLFRNESLLIGVTCKGCSAEVRDGRVYIVPSTCVGLRIWSMRAQSGATFVDFEVYQ